MRYLTGRGNVRCGIHLVREISFGNLSGRESVCRGCAWSGKCPSDICLVGDVSGRGNVLRGCVWSGKCPSRMCLVGEMSVGELSVGEESVGEMTVGDVSGNHQNTLYEKVRTIAEELNIKLEAAVTMKKSEWKRTIKDKIIKFRIKFKKE